MPDGTVAERLARSVVDFRLSDAPEAVCRQARVALLDTVGCVLAGAGSEVTGKVLETLQWEGGSAGNVPVPGLGLNLDALGAALVMGVSAHAYELDDGYTPGSAHPGSPVIPAVLAFAMREKLPLGLTLEAIVTGYEVMLAVAETVHPESRRQGFHNTAIAGVFGAAAAVAKLLGLNAVETTSALGLAGSHAGGLLAFWNPGEVGATDVKKLHPGKAARDGAFSAIAAAHGMRGPASVFEGKAGFFRAYSGKGGVPGPESRLPARPRIMGVYFKPWPCCRSLHGPIAIALELRDTGVKATDVTSIVVETYSLAAERSRTDAVGDDAQFSIPLSVALALDKGEVTYQALTGIEPEPVARSLAKKVEVRPSDEFDARYPSCRPARVTCNLKTGATLSKELDNPPGEPNAPLPEEQLKAKFLGNATMAISPEAARRVLDLILSADASLPTTSITEVMTPSIPRRLKKGSGPGKGFWDG